MNDPSTRKKVRIIILGLAATIIAIIVWSAIHLVSSRDKIAVIVKIAPYQATVLVDGKRVSNNSTISLAEGEHSVKASLDGFNNLEFTANVQIEADGNAYITNILEPNSDRGRELAEISADQYLEIEGIAGDIGTTAAEAFTEEYPVVQHLPENNMLFKIGYKNDNKYGIVIMVDTSQTYERTAVETLYSWEGIDPTDYKVEFLDYTNPFGGKHE